MLICQKKHDSCAVHLECGCYTESGETIYTLRPEERYSMVNAISLLFRLHPNIKYDYTYAARQSCIDYYFK
jgi:hypothetical protein